MRSAEWVANLVAVVVVACLIMGGIMGWAARGMRDTFRAAAPPPPRPLEPEGLEVRPVRPELVSTENVVRLRAPARHRAEHLERRTREIRRIRRGI